MTTLTAFKLGCATGALGLAIAFWLGRYVVGLVKSLFTKTDQKVADAAAQAGEDIKKL
jgi:hypothetical protein